MQTPSTPLLLEQLPDELLLLIGKFVDASPDALALVLVNRHLNMLFFPRLCALGQRLRLCQDGALAWAVCQDNLGAAQRAVAAGADPGIVFVPRYKFLLKNDYKFVHKIERNYGRLDFWKPGMENKPVPDDSMGYWDEEIQRSMTPLVMAIRHGNMEMIKLLVEGGADVAYEAPADGYSPIVVATREGCLDIVRFLVETGKIDLNARYEETNRTILGIATRSKQTAIVKKLPSALGLAIKCMRHQIAELLIADPRIAPGEDFLWDALLTLVIGRGDLEMLKILWPHRIVQDLVLTKQDYAQVFKEAEHRDVGLWLVKYYEETNFPSESKITQDGVSANGGMAAEAEADDAGDVMASGGEPAAE